MMTQEGSRPGWPSEIRLNPEKNMLRIEFTDGVAGNLPAELLRVTSPSAEVQGHSPAERKLVAGKRSVTISKIEAVGNYAVRLIFSDGHNTGLYSWPYLYNLVLKKEELWEGYLQQLTAAGLSRGT